MEKEEGETVFIPIVKSIGKQIVCIYSQENGKGKTVQSITLLL